jgi:hypothetical protein
VHLVGGVAVEAREVAEALHVVGVQRMRLPRDRVSLRRCREGAHVSTARRSKPQKGGRRGTGGARRSKQGKGGRRAGEGGEGNGGGRRGGRGRRGGGGVRREESGAEQGRREEWYEIPASKNRSPTAHGTNRRMSAHVQCIVDACA